MPPAKRSNTDRPDRVGRRKYAGGARTWDALPCHSRSVDRSGNSRLNSSSETTPRNIKGTSITILTHSQALRVPEVKGLLYAGPLVYGAPAILGSDEMHRAVPHELEFTGGCVK